MKLFTCIFALCFVVCLGQTEEAITKPILLPPCLDMCYALYAPICCYYPDGQVLTFSNACSAGIYNCQHNTSPVFTTKGHCICDGNIIGPYDPIGPIEVYPIDPILVDPIPVPADPAVAEA